MRIVDFIKSNNDYFEDFITRSTYHSNGIEGNTLSYAETYAIIFNDNSFDVKAKPRELYEAINHKYALNNMLNKLNENLTEKLIRETAIIINKNINEISGYRAIPVFIKGAEHIPPQPNQINQLMMYFVHNYNKTEYNDIFEKLAVSHIEFERLHPFEDGNGRTGRLLLNFELLKNDTPPIIIPKEERKQYFSFLQEKDINGLQAYFKMLSKKENERLKEFGFIPKP